MEQIKRYWGQHAQDSIIKQFFDAKGIEQGIYIDIGASEGIRFSNTLLLEKSGWQGICVEAHPSYFNLLKDNRPNSICYSAAVGDRDKVTTPIRLNYRASLTSLDLSLEGFFQQHYNAWYGNKEEKEINGFLNGMHEVEMRTIDSILQENKDLVVPKLNLLCIDIDGSEKYAFKGLTLDSWKPDMLVLEHSTIGHDIVDEYAKKSGYSLGRRLGSDTLYLRSEEDCGLLNSLNVIGEFVESSVTHVAGGPE